MAAAAVTAAERGWHVFPCRPGDKRPMVDRWEQRACADPERVAAHWPAAANVGVACGPSGLLVVDLDSHRDLPPDWQAIPGVVDGRDVLAQLCDWAGQPWPHTYTAATPSGGWHLYFRAPDSAGLRNTAGLLGPQIDTRGQGGYVVGAGSVIGGRVYQVLDDQPPVPLPAWLRAALTRPRSQPRQAPPAAGTGPANLAGLARTVRQAQPGQQTDTLVWAAFRLRADIAAGRAAPDDAEQLVQAALGAGMVPEPYVRYQVRHVLEGAQ